MKNLKTLNNYISEKLHLNKDTKYTKKEGSPYNVIKNTFDIDLKKKFSSIKQDDVQYDNYDLNNSMGIRHIITVKINKDNLPISVSYTTSLFKEIISEIEDTFKILGYDEKYGYESDIKHSNKHFIITFKSKYK